MQYKRLNEIAVLLNGYSFKSKEYVDTGIRIIRIANVQDGYIADERPCFYPLNYEGLSNYMLKEGDLLVSLTGNVGRVGLLPVEMLPAALNQRVSCIRLINKDLLLKFLFFYFRRKEFIRECTNASKGVAQLNLSTKWLENYLIPVPPLPEQERIVSRIEELFSQLDAGVATLKKTKAQLGVYRQAVLKEAFSTSKFSKIVEMNDIVTEIRIGPFGTMLHKDDYIIGGVPVINPQHIKINGIVASNRVTISLEKVKELESYRLQKNDVIMGRRGEMGRCAPISEMEAGWICGTGSIRFRLKPEFDASFYSQILSSPDVVHYLEENATGTTMKNLNEEIVKHIPVPYMTYNMQQEINRTIDSRMSVCDSIEQTTDAALQQSESLRQSILKEAFEGRL